MQQGSFSDPSATAVATAACTGLRWGELRELRWGLFEPAQDEELAELHATRAAVARVGDPKTAKIETSVPVIPQLASDDSPGEKGRCFTSAFARAGFRWSAEQFP